MRGTKNVLYGTALLVAVTACLTLLAAPVVAEDHLVLDHPFDIRKYTLELTPQLAGGVLDAAVGIDAVSLIDGLDTVLLNFCGGWSIGTVTVDGIPAEHAYDGEILSLYLPQERNAGQQFSLRIAYSGAPVIVPGEDLPAMQILSSAISTNSEPFGARYWFPCFDEPSDKAESGVEFYVTVPAGLEVAANGVLVEKTVQGAVTRHHWRHTHPISTYLIAVAAANYLVLHDAAGTVPLSWYLYPQSATHGSYDLARHPQMFECFTAAFGPYPFESYGVAQMPMNNLAMENQSMTFLSANLITGDRRFESTYAHELAHQWFGDSVTIADFRDIWLNEGFASYCQILWAEYLGGAIARDEMIRAFRTVWLNNDASDRHSVYRTTWDVPHLFSPTVYKKGALVLVMLRWQLGDEVFAAGMRQYYNRFAYRNATTADFEQVMEEVSGRDLGGFFTGWIYGSGFPVFEISNYLRTDLKSPMIHVTVHQAQTDDTVYAMDLPIDPDGSGPLPVARRAVSGRWHSFDVAPQGNVDDALIEENDWLQMQTRQADYPAPEISTVNGDQLRGKGRHTITVTGSGFTPASIVAIDSSFCKLISYTVSDDGRTLVLNVKAGKVSKKKRANLKVINPDGDTVIRRKALTLLPS